MNDRRLTEPDLGQRDDGWDRSVIALETSVIPVIDGVCPSDTRHIGRRKRTGHPPVTAARALLPSPTVLVLLPLNRGRAVGIGSPAQCAGDYAVGSMQCAFTDKPERTCQGTGAIFRRSANNGH